MSKKKQNDRDSTVKIIPVKMINIDEDKVVTDMSQPSLRALLRAVTSGACREHGVSLTFDQDNQSITVRTMHAVLAEIGEDA